jgi:cytochrome P450
MFSSEADIKSQARSTIFFVALSVAGIYVVYRRLLLPKPLPGIPYDREAAKKVFGDVTDLRTDPDGLAQWCGKKLARSGTPICQALMGPLETPVVIVADVGDVRERLMGRSEFDRSVYIIDRVPLLGRFHLNLKTTEEWRLARHWSKDLLTPQFMDGVANPAIELTTQRLIELWERKSRLAKGRAFDIDRDIKGLNIDIILAFYFGADMADSILAREVDHVRQLQDSDLVAEEHNSVTFPRAKLHDFCEGLIDISQKVANLYATPWPPKLAGWWTRYVSPHFRRYFAAKETFVRKIIAQAVQRSVKSQDPKRESGVDHMVWRENRAAERAGRKPKYGQQVFEDEVCLVLASSYRSARFLFTDNSSC